MMSGSEEPRPNCSLGVGENSTPCHKSSYTTRQNLIEKDQLSKRDYELIQLRSGVDSAFFSNVCSHHRYYFLKVWPEKQLSCYNPRNEHGKRITRNLRSISLEYAKKLNKIPGNVNKCKPGHKICGNCRNKLYNLYQVTDEGESSSSAQASSEEASSEFSQEEIQEPHNSSQEIQNLAEEVHRQEALETVNETLKPLGESPFKLHGIPDHSKGSYAKRKLESARVSLEENVSKIIKMDVSPKVEVEKLPDYAQQIIDDMNELIRLIKEALKNCKTRREKIQVLTLVPVSWSRKRVMDEFNVSEYAVRQARELLREKGLIAVPEPRKGKKLSARTVDLVKKFYEDDEYSRLMPGKKDKISINRNEAMQKRLMLCNLNELYVAFKFHHPNEKIGFSKFCSLRPKWCILAGSTGTHSVCVCTIHENVKLLLHGISSDFSYKDWIKLLVCPTDNRDCRENRDCMLRHCQNCPGNEEFQRVFMNQFEEWDPDDEITYSAWVSTDRTKQVELTVTLEDCMGILLDSLEALMPHSFIAKAQSKFLKDKKKNLKENEAVVILDFSQNFSFVLQDEVQGYHWTRESCSLHPVVIYTKKQVEDEPVVQSEDEPTVSSLCILSEDLEHDVGFVYESQRIITEHIKAHFPLVEHLDYFSDGCAGQYKNYKNFSNLCHHKNDFNLSASWVFFATSHGKSPSDGIGGTVKRLVTKASLQRDRGSDSINTVDKMFNFCSTNIDKIKFYNLKKEDICETRQKLQARFLEAKTVPGTRSFHHFIPISENTIATKRISDDEKHSLVFCFDSKQKSKSIDMSEILVNSYVACVYNDQWFFGMVLSKHDEEKDVNVSFLHPHGPAQSFSWPARKDTCYVPINNIISIVSPPSTSTATGRVYCFNPKEAASVQEKFSSYFGS